VQVGVLGKPFQKMRRRLTVTGASENIDGEAEQEPTPEVEKIVATKTKVRYFSCSFCILS